MFITKKHLARRTFLRGAGVAVALPLLDAMVPAGTALAKTAASGNPHLGYFYLPHGAIMDNTPHGAAMDHWTPTAAGRDFELKPILKPLEKFKPYLTIVSGLDNRPGTSAAVHAINPGTWLTCVHPGNGSNVQIGVSVDQIAARQIGQTTPLPSLELASETKTGNASCDGNFGCGYSSTLSFRTPTTPLPMESNPRAVFERLFGRGANAEERKVISRENASMLDLVMQQTASLQQGLGARDRAVLGDYLESVREIERRIQIMEQRDLSALNVPDAPIGVLPDFAAQLKLMFDIIALSYQADLTRVVSFMMCAEATNRTYNHIGISDAFHPLSHHGNDLEQMKRLVKIQTWHTEVFTSFVAKLAKMPDGDGSMLDHSILLYGSNMSNSNLHDMFPLPEAVVGGGCGRIKGGQHLRYPDHTPLANLHATLLDRAGVKTDSFGDSTGELSEI